MPHTDRHKEREIPIEFDFYNTLESLPENDALEPIIVRDLQIMGKVIGVFRFFA